MKKKLAAILTFSMAMSLAAFGGIASAGEVTDVALKVWVPEEEREILDPMIASFEAAHPEYNITWDISITGIDEAASLLDTDADTAADVFQIPSDRIPDRRREGTLQ